MLYVGLFLCVRVVGICCLCLLMALACDSFVFNCWLLWLGCLVGFACGY